MTFQGSILDVAFALVAQPAAAGGYGYASSLPYVDAALEYLGYLDFYGEQRDAIAYGVLIYMFFFGLLTTLALRERGFGFLVNALIGGCGVGLALFLCGPRFHLLAQVPDRLRFNATLLACAFASALMLILTALFKEAIGRCVGGFFHRFVVYRG